MNTQPKLEVRNMFKLCNFVIIALILLQLILSIYCQWEECVFYIFNL